MNKRNNFNLYILMVFIILPLVWMTPGTSESACGAAASSCKNCHEVKGEMRVSGQGDYHTQHAFGDFCVFCHSGNTAATSKTEAHEGMVKPLENLEQSCASCHPDDYEGRGKGYGAVIKPKDDSGGGGTAVTDAVSKSGAEKNAAPAAAMKAASESAKVESYTILPPTPDASAVSKEDLIDYNLYYTARMEDYLPGTLGDWILLALSLFMMMGFPLLYWFFGKKKSVKPAERVNLKQDVTTLQKDAMDEGMA